MTPSPKSAIDSRGTKILVRGTNWIGDTVMSMPAIQRLREFAPDSYIVMLCPGKLHDLWRHNPYINEIIPFGRKVNVKALRERRFDVAIIFPNSLRSARECKRAQIPRRVGFSGHWRRLFLTDIVPQPVSERPVYEKRTVADKTFKVKVFRSIRHQSLHYLDIIKYLGGNAEPVPPRMFLAIEEMPTLSKFMRDDGRPVLALNAGAEYGPAKRWLPDRFAEAAIKIAEFTDCRWLIVGSRADMAITSAIEERLRVAKLDESTIINVAGKTTLIELCALFKFCKVLLTNDTGPMHIAAAIGTPVVSIWGSTSPELTGPMGDDCEIIRQPVECSPCFLRECPIDFRCMNRVEVDPVVDAVLKKVVVIPKPFWKT
ncbi:MAG TPA: lipopolysaccharide heptosyltransferase II [Verrucomicrobiae bacterium]|nr:lipopolysaccharide heptosyltransferase II [Verrucomicrobiae bacterium]